MSQVYIWWWHRGDVLDRKMRSGKDQQGVATSSNLPQVQPEKEMKVERGKLCAITPAPQLSNHCPNRLLIGEWANGSYLCRNWDDGQLQFPGLAIPSTSSPHTCHVETQRRPASILFQQGQSLSTSPRQEISKPPKTQPAL